MNFFVSFLYRKTCYSQGKEKKGFFCLPSFFYKSCEYVSKSIFEKLKYLMVVFYRKTSLGKKETNKPLLIQRNVDGGFVIQGY